jgi:hypothetical protein
MDMFGRINLRHLYAYQGRPERRLVSVYFRNDDPPTYNLAHLAKVYDELQHVKGPRKLTAAELIGALAEQHVAPSMGGTFTFASCEPAPPTMAPEVTNDDGDDDA